MEQVKSFIPHTDSSGDAPPREVSESGDVANLKKLVRTKLRTKRARFTLDEAKMIPGQFVYGLCDLDGLFFVGRTRNASVRFERLPELVRNLHLARRIREAGRWLYVAVIDYKPANLHDAHMTAIRMYADRLVNVLANPYRLPTLVHVRGVIGRDALACCPLCDGPMAEPGTHLCGPCDTDLFRKFSERRVRARELAALAKALT